MKLASIYSERRTMPYVSQTYRGLISNSARFEGLAPPKHPQQAEVGFAPPPDPPDGGIRTPIKSAKFPA